MKSEEAAAKVNHLIDAAEANRRFVFTRSRTLRRQLIIQRDLGILGEPYPNHFARLPYLANLSLRGKMYHLLRTISYLHPSWTFCFFSAAAIHGLQVPYALLDTVHVGVIEQQNRHIAASYVKRHLIEPCECKVVDGMCVTGILPTVFDCLRLSAFSQALPIVDSALHRNLTSKSDLERFLHEHGDHKRGVQRVGRALRFADGRSANGGESTVRAIMIEQGFLLPELQVEIPDPLNPTASKMVDFYWKLPDGRTVILELDGFKKYHVASDGRPLSLEETQRVLADERRRESHINLTGATVLRISYEEAINPAYLSSMLMAAGVPRVLQ